MIQMIALIIVCLFLLSFFVSFFLSILFGYSAGKHGDPNDSIIGNLPNAFKKKWFPEKYHWIPTFNKISSIGLILSILVLMLLMELSY